MAHLITILIAQEYKCVEIVILNLDTILIE